MPHLPLFTNSLKQYAIPTQTLDRQWTVARFGNPLRRMWILRHKAPVHYFQTFNPLQMNAQNERLSKTKPSPIFRDVAKPQRVETNFPTFRCNPGRYWQICLGYRGPVSSETPLYENRPCFKHNSIRLYKLCKHFPKYTSISWLKSGQRLSTANFYALKIYL